ncbi:MAG: NifU family protein [Bdellovibrionales bacterium]|jgi:Fe-S cluster biogenesis protein NfuA|nr:NifU family protein [Bdellovibrionales bacterium]
MSTQSASQSAVRFEATPNPQTFRFSVESKDSTGEIVLTDRPVEFKSATEAQFSPLAKKLFGFPWAAGVYIGRDFITVTKQDWVDWDIIAEPLAGLIEEHLESGAPILTPPPAASASNGTNNGAKAQSGDSNQPQADDTDAVRLIKTVLNNEIRPMVAQDGGDITFAKYENGVVYIHMQGSCAGCPSSTMTLKMGIEVRLKEALPEIVEVVAV